MKKYIMTGLVMLLPFAVTLWIIGTVIDWLTLPFTGVALKILEALHLDQQSFLFLSPSQTFFLLQKFLILFFIFLFLLVMGAIGKHFLVSFFLNLGDRFLLKIPVISSIYKTSQELISSIFTSEKRAFKQVVLVPFPHQNCLSLGLITKEGSIDPNLVLVFVPSTPNPTSGFLIMYEKKQIIPLNISIEEAFQYILSCGALLDKKNILMSNDQAAGAYTLQE